MIKKIEEGVANIMQHYGFGQAEAKIMASLAVNGEMSAKELAGYTGYAYSTVINVLNFLSRMGFIKKYKKGKLSIYSANIDFVRMMENERKRLINILNDLKKNINGVKNNYKKRLSNLIIKVEDLLEYMKKNEEAI